MQYYIYVVSVLFGLVLGSFLNVVIWRLPRHESLSHPGSHCPKCGNAIRWRDNIPVVSWLVLRGTCRNCGQPIAIRYPAVEAMMGTGFGLALWRFGVSWHLLVAWAFIAALVAIGFIDYDLMIIPDRIVLPGLVIGLAASVAMHPHRWWVYLAAAAAAGTFFFLLVLIWPGGGMGMGDAKMAAFMGAVLGAQVLVALFAAFLFGSIVGVYLLAAKKASRKTKLPFGPFLAVGAVLGLFVGGVVIRAYLSISS